MCLFISNSETASPSLLQPLSLTARPSREFLHFQALLLGYPLLSSVEYINTKRWTFAVSATS